MNKKVLIVCIMVTAAVGGILIKQPLVSLGIHIALLFCLFYFLIKIYKGRNDLRFYLFPCVICQIATVGPYYDAFSVQGLGFYGLLSVALGGVVAIAFANNKRIIPNAPKLLLVGIFVVSMTWFAGQTMLINAAFQSSDTEIYTGEIKDKEMAYGRLLNDYWIIFEYFDDQNKSTVQEFIYVTKKTYSLYQVGDEIQVEIDHGLLGIEYYNLSREIDKTAVE